MRGHPLKTYPTATAGSDAWVCAVALIIVASFTAIVAKLCLWTLLTGYPAG